MTSAAALRFDQERWRRANSSRSPVRGRYYAAHARARPVRRDGNHAVRLGELYDALPDSARTDYDKRCGCPEAPETGLLVVDDAKLAKYRDQPGDVDGVTALVD